MKWNYRVVKTQEPISDVLGDLNGVTEELFEVFEMYYDDDGCIAYWSANPVAPSGDSLFWLKSDLQKMLEATNKPIINIEDLNVGAKV